MNCRPAAKPIMIQGTASSSGKSLVTAALCRILHEDGIRVAPFKAQNMSNNSFVTREGFEMGRAQVVQAIAAGCVPEVRMNPVLIKPSSDTGAQVVVHGRPSFFMEASSWHGTREKLRQAIKIDYHSLAREYEVIVLEGAGSPAEINLKENDVVNMGMATMADSPVLIVGDIDRGGVFASLVGTVQLLDEHERKRVKGFIINKFRGDVGLLEPGLRQLEAITGIPVLGVIPWIRHAIDDEDGQSEWLEKRNSEAAEVDICIIRLPHISNFNDFIPLETVPGCSVRWCDDAATLGSPDLLIIPGTKATIADLQRMKECGISEAVLSYAKTGGVLLGICGGFQMLGRRIYDPKGVESAETEIAGLGLLPMDTIFTTEKKTTQVRTRITGTNYLFGKEAENLAAVGYEIHMGESTFDEEASLFTVSQQSESAMSAVNGIADESGKVAGTYCHGLFDSNEVVKTLVNRLRVYKNLPLLSDEVYDRTAMLEADLRKLAAICREHLDIPRIMEVIG